MACHYLLMFTNKFKSVHNFECCNSKYYVIKVDIAAWSSN